MLNDPLANALSLIYNLHKTGKSSCEIKPASKIIKQVVEIMNKHNYLGAVEEIASTKGDSLKIALLGSINKCGAIKPRYSVKKDDYEKYEKRYLPARDFGIIFVATPGGIVTHKEAKEKKIGGRLIAYCY
ncbi:MAG: 30S ribosomal protein S8 [Nanoarchaeota archaeon]|nr:30S ribosomal protein S8 [Nanoarchaeota archaeon]